MKIRMKLLCTLTFVTILVNQGLSQNCGGVSLNSITNPGPYTVATLVESDGLRNGPSYSGATIYYPTNASPPFASIVIVPGFFANQTSIQAWGPYYASHGIIAMTIGTNSGFDYPAARATALLDGVETLRQENSRTLSPLVGNIDLASFAVSGWSMGGGGAQLAAVLDNSIKAVVGLCPWLDQGSLVPADLNHPVPVLILSGQSDPTAPPSSHANVHFDFTPITTNKLIYEVANGNHSVANNPTGGQGEVGKMALSWLKKHLVGDECYCPLLLDTPSTASRYLTTVECVFATCDDPTNVRTNGVTTTSAVLNWDPVPGADHYLVRGGVAGSGNVVELVINNGNVGSRPVSGLSPGTSFFWQIKSYCDADENIESNWSGLQLFTTSECEVPGGLHTTNYTGTSVRLNWNPVLDGTGYTIRGRLASSPNWQVTRYLAGGLRDYKDFYGLNPSRAYHWAIQSECIDGQVSAWSSTQSLGNTAKLFQNRPVESAANDRVEIRPNPFHSSATITFSNPNDEVHTIRLLDMNGKAVQDYPNVAGNSLLIQRADLSSGIYLLEVKGAEVHRSMIVVE